MRINKYLIALLVSLTVVAAGCVSSPVMNIDESPVSSEIKSSKDVKKAIIRAATARGWKVKTIGKGHLQATLLTGGHMAKVDIKYNRKTYSITYKDSSPSLKYDGANIHRRYNHWIVTLDRDIQAQLGALY